MLDKALSRQNERHTFTMVGSLASRAFAADSKLVAVLAGSVLGREAGERHEASRSSLSTDRAHSSVYRSGTVTIMRADVNSSTVSSS